MSLLGQVQKEIGNSIENGDTFKDFQKRIQPKMQKWLDSVRREDPRDLEGPELEQWKQRKDRYRLRRIFEINTRQSYSQHHYSRGMDNEFNTHVIYRIGPSINHRADHVALDGLVLPKNHPMWDSHWPPNGWNCKCYTRFITADKLEEYRRDGVPDLGSRNEGGRLTRMKAIKETAPPIQWRKFERSDGQTVRVPMDIDPGFEWNAGKLNRGTWLKDQALRKARALELAPKEMQKLEQLIVGNAAQQQAYRDFVERHYGRESSGKTTDVGLVQEALKSDLIKRQGSLPSSDLLMMPDKLLNAKNAQHGKNKHGDSSVSKAEFLRVPEMLQRPDILMWDRMCKQYTILVHTPQRQILLLPVGINQIKSLKGEFWTLRSVYRVDSYHDIMNETYSEGKQNILRYEVIRTKK